ncbi:hypothetical protein M3185_13680 [Kocuria rosea]|nr:hypothetical protein [Kocuria rosea]
MGSMILSGYAGDNLPGYVLPEDDVNTSDERIIDSLTQPNLEGKRTLRISVTDHIEIIHEFTVTTNHPIVSDLSAGKIDDHPSSILSMLSGYLEVESASEDYIEIFWNNPTLLRSDNGDTTIVISGVSEASLDLPLTIQYRHHPYCASEKCTITAIVTTANNKLVTSAEPSDTITSQSPMTTIMRDLTDDFTLVVGDKRASGRAERWEFPKPIVSHFPQIWRTVLLVGPWFVAYYVFHRSVSRGALTRHDGSANFDDLIRPSVNMLLTASAVLVVGQMFSLLEVTVFEWRERQYDLYDLGQRPWFVPPGMLRVTPVIIGVLALWAWNEGPRLGAIQKRFLNPFKLISIMVGLPLVVFLVLDLWPYWSQLRILGVLLLAILFGLIGLAKQLGMSFPRAMFNGSCAAFLVITISLVGTRHTQNAEIINGVLTALTMVGFMTSLILGVYLICKIPGPNKDVIPNWVIALSVTFSIVFSVPAEIYDFQLFPISPSDVIAMIYGLEPFIRFGLTALVFVVLYAWPHFDLPDRCIRGAGVAVVALFTVSSDTSWMGIPVAFIAGFLLITVILIPRTAGAALLHPDMVSRGLDLSGSDKGSSKSAAKARNFLSHLKSARLQREANYGLRKKVVTGDIALEKESEARSEIAKLLHAPIKISSSDRHEVLGWGGVGDPWARGLRGAATSSTVGLIFFIPQLADIFSILGDIRGTSPWVGALNIALGFGYPLYGFAFGYFMPIIRGSMGIAKAAHFFVVLAVSHIVALVCQPSLPEDISQTVFLLCFQFAVLCVALGVGADLGSLRHAGAGVDQLAELYHVNRLTLWSSGVAVAAVSALITGLVGSALPVLMQPVLPPSPPAISSEP